MEGEPKASDMRSAAALALRAPHQSELGFGTHSINAASSNGNILKGVPV
jgi:hypothetical protein